MNKLIIAIVTTLMLTAAGTTLAQDFYGEPGKKGQRHQRGPQGMPVVDKMMHAIRRLDLDDAQKESIKAVMQGLKAEIHPLMEETRASHLQLKELIKAETYDEKAVAVLAEKEGEMAAERLMLTSKALSDVFAYLTDEQRDQLAAMAEERMERRGERRKHRPQES